LILKNPRGEIFKKRLDISHTIAGKTRHIMNHPLQGGKMLNSILKGILTVVCAWVVAVIVDRVLTKAVTVVWGTLKRRKPAEAAA